MVHCRMDHQHVGHYAFFGAKKESFLVALFSSKNRKMKANCISLDDMMREIEKEKDRGHFSVNACVMLEFMNSERTPRQKGN